MAQGLGAHGAQRGALAEARQAALLLGLVLAAGGLALVAALLVRGEEAAEGDDGAAAPTARRSRAGAPSTSVAPRRTEAVEPRASAICEATVRFQISS